MNWPSLLIGAAVGSAVTASLYALCSKPVQPSLDHIANLITEQGAQMNEALAEIATEVTALKGAVFDTKSLGFYWHIKARNREILATSESYNTRAGRDRIAARIAKASGFELVARKEQK